MAQREMNFQPGAVLHDAIIGAFKMHGGSFERWCREKKINPTVARQATTGQSRGKNGRNILAELVEAAGPEIVRQVYEKRVLEHADELRKGQRR
ncbi:hypothetical protein [Halocynthiibacter styelae]|uniref:Uncharacterized protein n=1 Tax=Halocynthiibacter styelae TaxID=2761955 RepID=A0A8J7LQP0_9RHOB|nr:hypothetical protein [Paenihalocynthiibacter styelae]MBI1495371.1 hypothetical protein [Paenihalocynthiibacter styelae]